VGEGSTLPKEGRSLSRRQRFGWHIASEPSPRSMYWNDAGCVQILDSPDHKAHDRAGWDTDMHRP
jgi:hypothetical protein